MSKVYFSKFIRALPMPTGYWAVSINGMVQVGFKFVSIDDAFKHAEMVIDLEQEKSLAYAYSS